MDVIAAGGGAVRRRCIDAGRRASRKDRKKQGRPHGIPFPSVPSPLLPSPPQLSAVPAPAPSLPCLGYPVLPCHHHGGVGDSSKKEEEKTRPSSDATCLGRQKLISAKVPFFPHNLEPAERPTSFLYIPILYLPLRPVLSTAQASSVVSGPVRPVGSSIIGTLPG